MKKSVPPTADLRNPRAHLDLAAGLPGAFEELFSALPAAEAEPDPLLDDGAHEPLCPCWRCDDSPVFGPDEDETFDMAQDLAADRRWS